MWIDAVCTLQHFCQPLNCMKYIHFYSVIMSTDCVFYCYNCTFPGQEMLRVDKRTWDNIHWRRHQAPEAYTSFYMIMANLPQTSIPPLYQIHIVQIKMSWLLLLSVYVSTQISIFWTYVLSIIIHQENYLFFYVSIAEIAWKFNKTSLTWRNMKKGTFGKFTYCKLWDTFFRSEPLVLPESVLCLYDRQFNLQTKLP